jgi:hypothetical protein
MVDLDLADLKLHPAEYLKIADYENATYLENKNKIWEKAFLGIISAGLIVLIYYIIKDEPTKEK